MRKLILFVATGAGSGYSPIASGTAGSLVGLLLYVPLRHLPGGLFLLVLLAVTGLGTWVAGRAERLFGREDDGRITIDEVVGMLIALAFLPFRVDTALAAFLLFRLFDIWKPPPARRAESLPGGVGVMADDLVAGLYANLVGQLIWRVILPGGFS